jgi:methionyl-tRNA formyltransferase
MSSALRRRASIVLRRIGGCGPGSPTESARRYARARGITYEVIPIANSEETVRRLRSHAIDHVVSRGVGILRPILLDMPGLVFLNAHAGRLPRYGGMNVVEWAVFRGDPVYGTIHRIDAGIDTGDVLDERPLELGRPSTVAALRAAAFAGAWGMMAPALGELAAGRLGFRAQPRDPHRTQWFRMHPVLLDRVSEKLRDGSFFSTQEREVKGFDIRMK